MVGIWHDDGVVGVVGPAPLTLPLPLLLGLTYVLLSDGFDLWDDGGGAWQNLRSFCELDIILK
jgi:hypothetical protein